MESGDGTLSAKEFRVAASAFSELWKRFNSSLPQWSWVPSPKRSWVHYQNMEGYLSLENVILPRFFVKDDVMEEEECSSTEEDDFIDTAELVRNHDSGAHHYNFHIVYSLSYRVPVLYFRAYCSDGQPLALKDIEKDIPVNSAQLLTKSKWTFLTQELVNAESLRQLLLKDIYLATVGVHFRVSHPLKGFLTSIFHLFILRDCNKPMTYFSKLVTLEHPILHRPWYTLHPCGTMEWMRLLLGNKTCIDQGGLPIDKYLVSWFSVVGQVFGLKIPFEMVQVLKKYVAHC